MPTWMKVMMYIVGGFAIWSFVTAITWGVTEPFWKWCAGNFGYPHSPNDTAEVFSVFWPFYILGAPLVLAIGGPIVLGWKIRARMTERKRMEKENTPQENPHSESCRCNPCQMALNLVPVLTPELQQIQASLGLSPGLKTEREISAWQQELKDAHWRGDLTDKQFNAYMEALT